VPKSKVRPPKTLEERRNPPKGVPRAKGQERLLALALGEPLHRTCPADIRKNKRVYTSLFPMGLPEVFEEFCAANRDKSRSEWIAVAVAQFLDYKG
jgi:hypothetical protein